MKFTYDKIEKLVSEGESETLEFKKSTGQMTQAAKTLCAFLNTKGGIVLFGVTDAKKIIGQGMSADTKEKIAAMINQFSPNVDFEIEYIEIPNSKNYVIAIQTNIDKENIPYTFNGKAYWRNQNTTSNMSREKYNYLLTKQLKIDQKWGAYIADNYSLKDLDEKEIKNTVREGIKRGRLPRTLANESIKKVLEGFNLITENNITNAGVALFAKKIKSNFLHCKVKLAKFIGKTKTKGFIDERQYEGNVFKIIEESETFIRRNMKIGIEFDPDSIERIDRPEYPMLAIREALINSVCHRDYLLHGSSLMVAMFDDRLEIWNPGKLLPGISIDDLKQPHHKSLHRNESIAKVFYARKLIEGWGTGTTKMIELCEEMDMKAPEFSEINDGFMVTFWPYLIKAGITKKVQRELELGKREQMLMEILQELKRPVSVTDLKAELDKKDIPEKASVRTLNRSLKVLFEKGLVVKTGAGRSLVWGLKIDTD